MNAHDLDSLLRDLERPREMAPIVFMDVKTSGGDPARHEIIEIAMVRVDGRTFDVQAELELFVVPTHIETADPDALDVCGFYDGLWAKAVPLRQALAAVSAWIHGAFLAGHHVSFDWAFLDTAFRRLGLGALRADYPRLDTSSLAWSLFAGGDIPSLSLDCVTHHLGLERPYPHRALADVRLALEVARRFRVRDALGSRIEALAGDEREIVDALLERMSAGRLQYGPWRVNDGRDYPREAYAEVLDGLHYIAAEIVRLRRERQEAAE